MTDPAPPPAAAPRLPSRWRWLLIGSLALNLLVVGTVAGMALRWAGDGRRMPLAERSLAAGPWAGALDRGDHRALRRAFEATGRDPRAALAEDRADRAALVAALRAEPFDPATLQAVAERMGARLRERAELGQRLVIDHLVAMSPDERRAVADRMERHAMHRDGLRGGQGRP